ncbi:MAG: ATP-binding cassette domain-containing protein [Desulfobacterales bacterium]|nr:ATP-binding cassette domain-containing protein [Desulfobacterales bacterium]
MKPIRRPDVPTRYRVLLDMIRQSRGRLFMAMVSMLLVSASTVASAYLIKPVLDDIFVRKDAAMLMALPLAVVVIYLMRGIGMYGQEYFLNYVGQDIIRRLRTMLYDRICDLPLAFFHRERTGVLMSRITNDVNVIKAMVSSAVTSVIRDFFTILGLVGLIFYLDWKMALGAMVILPAAFYPIVEFGRRVRRVSTDTQSAMAELSAFLHETFTGTKIVKAFGMEAHEKGRFSQMAHDLFRIEIRAVIARSLSSPVMEFLGGMGIAFIIWFGGSRVVSGTYTPGTFMSFLGAVIMLYDPVKKISKVNNAVQEGLAATERIFDILETESEIQEVADPQTIPPMPHRVTFFQVSFGYGKDLVLKDINLDVAPGEILALVGMSGGGKTSLVNLIPRFYDVTRGEIAIDGVDIRRATIASLRSQIAVVTQEPILFNDTVRNNIAYGNPRATEADVAQAARDAYAYDFIMGFPKGFETPIGELGSRLSGGEKQRLCIARALIKDAPILILDEATSALDTESERLVQKALENLMRGRTTFVIAHRLSTIGYAHRIIVVVGGRIVEEGSHDELMACGGEYCKLYQMQYENNEAAESSVSPEEDPYHP